MISFTREGSVVTAQIEANVGVDKRFFRFTVSLSDDVYASMLRENFDHYLRDKVKSIREEEYEKGWADAKAKRKKQTWFAWSTI